MLRLQLILIFVYAFTFVKAQQVCTGNLGDPIIEAGSDFGRGTQTFGNPTPANTTYQYIAGTPQDGFYTLAKTTAGMNTAWHQNITNHTPNDPNGYMMVVNASYTQDIFFKTTVRDLCPNTTYEFASYIINILNRSGIKPNIKFTIENDGIEIPGGFTTGDIPESATPQWQKYGTTFTTPANMGTITLTMSNVNPGGNGNDVALDDITFRPCGPVISPALRGTNATTASFCEGNDMTFNIDALQPVGFTDVAFQWQKQTNNEWVDIPGATQKDYVVQFTNAVVGDYHYRLAAAERINIGSLKCRVVSAPIDFFVKSLPIAKASNGGPYCAGDEIQLRAEGGDHYQWTGPNNYTSTDQNPIILNATTAMQGIYSVTVSLNGCTAPANTELQILDRVVGSTNFSSVDICENTGITLKAFGGTQYTWMPATGLSNLNSDETFASPKDSTIYQVKISNGVCYEMKEIKVNVLKNAMADAGDDKKIFAGSSVTLNGKISGDEVTYFWSPADFLDDPTKLNPIATPKYDITYTLNVISKCVSSTDAVFIKVYPDILIPNSFSPNGDGFNDTWNIPAAGAFPNPKLKIVNRYGALVYQSVGFYKPWDGKLNGKDLPVGTYYYTIYFNEDFKTYSGWVFLTR
ncbi:gliding motility-associated C-terminal domain-containing protein [Pedobacter changchengzhani]|uniref:Gliding motility-associated C-terminal domain-containing protein n=1 Tax=Pedobacter changchengzhani TaxID=2529274 RepID=A0A4R5MKT9_9SPHI|nr:gliding motility-associated C-terminal domain-containing protein [Pedobacter changchengzhani]TDG36347.1 gliding motility-associated C-terminal domain-containing protein [Pedobacter changchengzhani]